MPTILVVEDDLRGRYLICEVLRREGYQVVQAGDGLEALEVLHTQRIDLVISDFVMPNMDGLSLVGKLSSLNPRVPIIFITGYLSERSGKILMEQVAEILPKPFEFDALRSAVQRLLARAPTD
jgi:CheY-like chemotaxis protein